MTCGRGSLAMTEQKTGIAPSEMDAKVLRPPAPASYSLVQHSAASPSLLSQPSKAAPESGLPKESTAVHAVGSCPHRCLRHLAGLYATEQLSAHPSAEMGQPRRTSSQRSLRCLVGTHGHRARPVPSIYVYAHTTANESRGRTYRPRPSYLIPENSPLFPFQLRLCLPSDCDRHQQKPSQECGEM